MAAALVVLVATFALASAARGPARAQSPAPTNKFVNVTPGTTVLAAHANGAVVEGLGGGSCAYSEGTVATTTAGFVNQHIYTWTEISPQAYCQSLSQYETEFSDIIAFVEANAAANAGTYWLGFMLDEEYPEFEFSVADLEAMNAAVESAVRNTAGITWWSNELFSSQGAVDQATFTALQGHGYPAPQIATAYMVQLTNGYVAATSSPTLVTWSAGYPYPYRTEAAAVAAVNGATWQHAAGLPWDNEFETSGVPLLPAPDVNGDGAVNAVDALCVLRFVALFGPSPTCPSPLAHPDVNADGVVDATDALCVLRQVAGLVATAGCPAMNQFTNGNAPLPLPATTDPPPRGGAPPAAH